ncbi:MAG: hypothetical protein QOF98_235 [Streptomyces sp.]|nr:hypothetical protein [Streptomyces sp.]
MRSPIRRTYCEYVDQHTARTSPPYPEYVEYAEYPEYAAHPARPARNARAAFPVAAVVRRLRTVQRPRPRLTGLGTGLLTTVITVLGGAVDSLLFDGPGVFFGLVFVAASVVGAVYVRPYDLVAAPVAAPIAFAVGITLTADSGSGGLAGHLIGVFTGLALMTGWLYTGTVLAALIAGVRALRRPSRRPRSPRCSATPPERSPR